MVLITRLFRTQRTLNYGSRLHRTVLKGFLMVGIILITTALVFIVGFMWNLSGKNKALVTASIFKSVAIAGVYSFKMLWKTSALTVNTGKVAADMMESSSSEVFVSLEDFNRYILSKGGSLAYSAAKAEEHMSDLGMTQANRILIKKLIEHREKFPRS